jgi:hypothetical protein
MLYIMFFLPHLRIYSADISMCHQYRFFLSLFLPLQHPAALFLFSGQTGIAELYCWDRKRLFSLCIFNLFPRRSRD